MKKIILLAASMVILSSGAIAVTKTIENGILKEEICMMLEPLGIKLPNYAKDLNEQICNEFENGIPTELNEEDNQKILKCLKIDLQSYENETLKIKEFLIAKQEFFKEKSVINDNVSLKNTQNIIKLASKITSKKVTSEKDVENLINVSVEDFSTKNAEKELIDLIIRICNENGENK